MTATDDFLDELLERLDIDPESIEDGLREELLDYIEGFAESYWRADQTFPGYPVYIIGQR